MTAIDTVSYYLTLLAIALAPGPLMLLLMARAASNDIKGAIGFAFGTALGSIAVLTAVCFGLSLWMTRFPEVLSWSKFLMLAYILWIARDVWKGGFDMSGQVQVRRSGLGLAVGAGFLTCVLSPYMLILYPLVLPEVMNIEVIEMPAFVIVTLATFAAEATAAVLIVILAAQLRRLGRSPRAMLVLNRSLACVLAAGGGWMALA